MPLDYRKSDHYATSGRHTPLPLVGEISESLHPPQGSDREAIRLRLLHHATNKGVVNSLHDRTGRPRDADRARRRRRSGAHPRDHPQVGVERSTARDQAWQPSDRGPGRPRARSGQSLPPWPGRLARPGGGAEGRGSARGDAISRRSRPGGSPPSFVKRSSSCRSLTPASPSIGSRHEPQETHQRCTRSGPWRPSALR
jgi:hypothetical protein